MKPIKRNTSRKVNKEHTWKGKRIIIDPRRSRFLSSAKVAALFSLKRHTIIRLHNKGDFPKPYIVGRGLNMVLFWDKFEIADFIQNAQRVYDKSTTIKHHDFDTL